MEGSGWYSLDVEGAGGMPMAMQRPWGGPPAAQGSRQVSLAAIGPLYTNAMAPC